MEKAYNDSEGKVSDVKVQWGNQYEGGEFTPIRPGVV